MCEGYAISTLDTFKRKHVLADCRNFILFPVYKEKE